MSKTNKGNEDIRNKAKEIEKLAKKKGLDNNPFFKTTFHALDTQMEMLASLEEAYRKDGATITKEYVKGRENICIHPAVDKYTNISDSAMKKINTLKEMCDKASDEDEEDIEMQH